MATFLKILPTTILVIILVVFAIGRENYIKSPKSSIIEVPAIPITFLGEVKATAYRSVPAQTKPKGYYWTANGERCNVHGCAVSRDFLKKNGGPLDFGDLILIDKIGFKFVNDTMNARHRRRIDIWVNSYVDEKKFDKEFRHDNLKIWLIQKGN